MMTRGMHARVGVALVLAAGLTAGVLVADDVLLANGESFEGVIARLDGEQVVIRLEFGELRVAAESVARIDATKSPLSEYLDRRKALIGDGGTAQEWLELARFACSAELRHSCREALLEAARVDPELEGLGPEMRAFGYDFDSELGRWIPYAERMRRAGLVLHLGQWVRPEERAAESQRAGEERREVEETLSRAVEILALAQLERETRATEESRRTARAAPAVPYGFPVAHFGGYYFPPLRHPGGERPDATPAPGADYGDLIRRPPGSLLPPGGANSGVRLRPPGSLLPTFVGKGTG